MHAENPQSIVPFMDKIAQTCVKVIADPRTAEPLDAKDKYAAGEFLKTVVAPNATATLQNIEAQMSPDEKE